MIILIISVTGREREEREELEFSTRFQSTEPETAGSSPSVPPAVIRSLRNIRRDVVVDIAGRNNVR